LRSSEGGATRTAQRWIFGPLAVLALAGLIGVALSPYLLVHAPLGLIALSPLVRHLVLVAPSVDFIPFVAIATARLFAPDPFMYALGRRYGRRAITWVEARSVLMGRFVRIVEGLFHRAGSWVLFVSPGLTASTMAGVFGMPRRRFVIVNVSGTLALVLLLRYVGERFHVVIAEIQAWVALHLAPLTGLTSVLALIGWIVWRRRARARLAELEPPSGT
jgi:membrane protein DedA with SNARE-associated domain